MLQEFISTFFEATAFMILWSKFNFERNISRSIVVKNLIIVVLTSFVVLFTNEILGSYYSILVNYLFIVFIISLLYHKSLLKTLVQLCINTIFIIIIELIIIYPIKFLGFNFNKSSFGIVEGIILCILCMIVYFFMPNNIFKFIRKINYIVINYIVINLILYIIIYKVFWEYDKKLLLNNITIFTCILITIFILNLFLSHYIVKINEKNKAMEVNNKYIPIIKDVTEEIRQRQHEFKNHLNAISGMVQVLDGNELKDNLLKYIKSLNNFIQDIEKVAYIDNIILRSIIYIKLREAKTRRIKFSYNVSNELSDWKIQDYELSEVITNMLNNAFEAVMDKEHKIVILDIYKDGEKNVIEVKNTIDSIDNSVLRNMFKRGFSTKKGKDRGYGLYNTKKIVESNEGRIQLSLEDNVICFRILL
jgi:two-component system, LytTR family, sensor histidine kinase AgrC